MFLLLLTSSCEPIYEFFLFDNEPELSRSIRQSQQLGVFVDSCAITMKQRDDETELPLFGEAWLEKRWRHSRMRGAVPYENDNYYTLIIKSRRQPVDIYNEAYSGKMHFFENQFAYTLDKARADSVNVFVVKAFTGESYAPNEQRTIGKLIVQRWGKKR